MTHEAEEDPTPWEEAKWHKWTQVKGTSYFKIISPGRWWCLGERIGYHDSIERTWNGLILSEEGQLPTADSDVLDFYNQQAMLDWLCNAQWTTCGCELFGSLL